MKKRVNVFELFERLPKYLAIDNSLDMSEYFCPVIIKRDWDGNTNAYWAFYGKETKFGYSKQKLLFAVCGTTLESTLKRFTKLCLDYEAEGWISGKTWRGPKPHAFDFGNDDGDHSLIE